jgi:hypothetical protein
VRTVSRIISIATLISLALWLPACEEIDETFERKLCDPSAGDVTPASGTAEGGTEVVLTGRFVSSSYDAFGPLDVAVRFGGIDAEVLTVDTAGCGPCEDCLVEAEICLDCWDVCNGDTSFEDETSTCVEEVRVVAPASVPGEAVVSLFNGHGSTQDFQFTYLDWCEDGLDNDGDGLADGDDPGCTGSAGTSETGPCENAEDDDGDGWTDLDDPGCADDPAGADEGGTGDTACNNGLDDDGDGWVDGEDVDCEDALDDDENAPLGACENGADDDGDGWIDSEDPDCETAEDEELGVGVTECNDGLDNDGDGLADPDDPGCDDALDDDETD